MAIIQPTSQYVNKEGKTEYRFTFGPWNIHPGADPFGPAVRGEITFAKKVAMYRTLGFAGVQFHDDDAVPGIMDKSLSAVGKKAREEVYPYIASWLKKHDWCWHSLFKFSNVFIIVVLETKQVKGIKRV